MNTVFYVKHYAVNQSITVDRISEKNKTTLSLYLCILFTKSLVFLA